MQQQVPQDTFFRHFDQPNHNGKEDWEFTIIDGALDIISLRIKNHFGNTNLIPFYQQVSMKKRYLL